MVLTQDVETKLRLLLAQNRKLEAVKLVLDSTGCGLKEAKEFVDNFAGGQKPPAIKALPADLDTQILTLLSQGEKLHAVKLYKEATGLGLAESKDYVDGIQNGGPSFDQRPSTNKRDTAIDQIMEQQLQSRVLVQSSSGVSPTRMMLLFLVLIGIIGLLIYLFEK